KQRISGRRFDRQLAESSLCAAKIARRREVLRREKPVGRLFVSLFLIRLPTAITADGQHHDHTGSQRIIAVLLPELFPSLFADLCFDFVKDVAHGKSLGTGLGGFVKASGRAKRAACPCPKFVRARMISRLLRAWQTTMPKGG